MRPQDGRVWRKNARRQKHSERELRQQPTQRQRAIQLITEAEDVLARQAHIDQAWDLPFLIAGTPGVTIMTLGDDEA